MAQPIPGDAPRPRILVVDDDPETAKLVRTWFGGEPYEILDAPDGVLVSNH